MPKVMESIEVRVPVDQAYNQWTQFEEFPKFMEGVQEVKQLDDTSLHWVAEIAGRTREWDAKITEQTPDQRIAWTNIDGVTNSGVVTFHKIDDNTSKIMVQFEYEPDGIVEKFGDVIGVVKTRTKGDLTRFKEFIEQRGKETGAWRGEVEQENVT
ncbi:MAG: SRPBCC family protein [Actinomycetota bacterium]